MATGLALDRCSLHGIDSAHEEDCWGVIKIRERDEAGNNVRVADHVTFTQATALVVGVPVEEIEQMAARIEQETPEEYEAWLKGHTDK